MYFKVNAKLQFFQTEKKKLELGIKMKSFTWEGRCHTELGVSKSNFYLNIDGDKEMSEKELSKFTFLALEQVEFDDEDNVLRVTLIATEEQHDALHDALVGDGFVEF